MLNLCFYFGGGVAVGMVLFARVVGPVVRSFHMQNVLYAVCFCLCVYLCVR